MHPIIYNFFKKEYNDIIEFGYPKTWICYYNFNNYGFSKTIIAQEHFNVIHYYYNGLDYLEEEMLKIIRLQAFA